MPVSGTEAHEPRKVKSSIEERTTLVRPCSTYLTEYWRPMGGPMSVTTVRQCPATGFSAARAVPSFRHVEDVQGCCQQIR
jgi:hypothetical protein